MVRRVGYESSLNHAVRRRTTRKNAAPTAIKIRRPGSLNETHRAKAVISPDAPDHMLTTDTRKAAIQEDRGIAYDELTTEQRGLPMAVIEEYASAGRAGAGPSSFVPAR